MEENTKQKNEYTLLDAFKSFFFLILIMVGVSFLFEIILIIVASATKKTFEQISNGEIVTIIKYILNPIVFIVYFFVYNHIRKLKVKECLSDGQQISMLPISISMVLAIICIFLFTPFMNLIDYWFSEMGYSVDNTIPLYEKMKTSGTYFLLGVMVFALLPAIAEELIFRGLIQKGLSTRLKGFATIMLTSIMFVLIHGSLQQTVYQLIVGIILSFLVAVGGSVVYSIILHFLSNFFVLLFSTFDIVSYLSSSNTIYYNVFTQIFPILLFLLGVVLVAILFWVLKYLRNKNFFRYDPKTNKKIREKNVNKNAVEKIKLKDLWANTSYIEKVFLLSSFALVGIIWIINTISGFLA